MSEEYNGWVNRETWALNLWLGNDEGLYNEVREIAERATSEYVVACDSYGMEPTDGGRAFRVGEAILEWVRDDLFTGNYGDVTDMRSEVGSLWRVDEFELGSAWVEEGAVE